MSKKSVMPHLQPRARLSQHQKTHLIDPHQYGGKVEEDNAETFRQVGLQRSQSIDLGEEAELIVSLNRLP